VDVARWAASRGVRLFCLTDHDTHDGYRATHEVLSPSGCQVLRGLELSCREYDRTIHLLILGLREGAGLVAFDDRLTRVAEQRRKRLRAICERLRSLGIVLDEDAIAIRTHGKTAGRPDVARALVDAGICTSPQEAFTRFLHDGGPADVPIERIGVEEGLVLARAAGARVSLAHPHTLREFFLVRDLFIRFRHLGLEGIEALYGRYGAAESSVWLRLARELDLVPTAGSDFHGEMSPDVSQPVVELPDAQAQRILDWLAL